MNPQTKKQLLLEVEELRARLEEAEETLRAIRSGEVDALVAMGPEGERIYTLEGAGEPYRVLVETISEGAVTLSVQGTILYCNRRFAEMLKTSPDKVIGKSIYTHIGPEHAKKMEALLQGGGRRSEIQVRGEDDTSLPALVSTASLKIGDEQGVCMVVTDLTEQKRIEKVIEAGRLARTIMEQATEPMVVCDQSGTIIETNEAAQRLLGKNLLFQSFDERVNLAFSSQNTRKTRTIFGKERHRMPVTTPHHSMSSVNKSCRVFVAPLFTAGYGEQ